MFRHPAWAFGNYSGCPPAAGTVITKPTGGFIILMGNPVPRSTCLGDEAVGAIVEAAGEAVAANRALAAEAIRQRDAEIESLRAKVREMSGMAAEEAFLSSLLFIYYLLKRYCCMAECRRTAESQRAAALLSQKYPFFPQKQRESGSGGWQVAA